MAMQFMDGFDYLTAANIGLKWDPSSSVVISTGVFGKGKAISGNFTVVKTLPSNFVTGFQGFHYFTGSFGAGYTICSYIDASTTQVDLRVDATGAPFFTRNGTTIGSVSTTRFSSNQWVWIETKAVINSATGEASLRVNGTAILTQTGLNTQATANAFFNKIQVTQGGFGNQTQLLDNYHFWDATAGSGNDPSTFFGEHLIDTSLAIAAGSNTQWLKGGSTINANNFQQVNEANEDGDTTYVFMSASGANDIDSYQFASMLETSGTIAIIAIDTIDRIDDAGPHTFDDFVKSGASTSLSAAISPSASYLNHQMFFALDPQGSVAWTLTRRNAAEFGYKLIS